MSELTSAAVPPPVPDDHATGSGDELIVYIDLGCPHCAAAWPRIRALDARLVVRHFPIAGKHPRAPALHAAAEAAGIQGRFFEMVDSLYADRRSDEVAGRVRRDFETGIRGGVSGTPAGFKDGKPVPV